MTSLCLSYLKTQGTSLLECSVRYGKHVISGDFWAQWPFQVLLWLSSREKWALKVRLHHWTRIKKENTLTSSSQGEESYPFHYTLLPPSPVLTKETKSLPPSHVKGFLRDVPPSALKWTTDSAHLPWQRDLESQQGLERPLIALSKAPDEVFKSTHHISSHALWAYYRYVSLCASLVIFLPF